MGKHRASSARPSMPARIRGLKAHRRQLGRTGVYDLQFELLRRSVRADAVAHYIAYTGGLVTPAVEEFAKFRLFGRVA